MYKNLPKCLWSELVWFILAFMSLLLSILIHTIKIITNNLEYLIWVANGQPRKILGKDLNLYVGRGRIYPIISTGWVMSIIVQFINKALSSPNHKTSLCFSLGYIHNFNFPNNFGPFSTVSTKPHQWQNKVFRCGWNSFRQFLPLRNK